MSDKSSFLKTQLTSIVLIVLVLVMGVEILFLVRQNKKLREALVRSSAPVKILSPEEKVPSLIGVNLKGEELKLGYPSSAKTLLFFFSPTCPACEENLDFWGKLYKDHSSDRLRIVAATGSDRNRVEEFARKFKLAFPVLIVTDLKLLDQYKVEVVPQTMLIDESGTVLNVWPGTLQGKFEKEIESAAS